MHTAIEILIGLALIAVTLFLLPRYTPEIDRHIAIPAARRLRGWFAFTQRGR